MKIVICIQDITTCGGTERTSCCLANTFAKYGHEVSIVSLFRYGEDVKFPLSENVRVEYVSSIPYSLKMSSLLRLKSVTAVVKKVKQYPALNDADVIIGQNLLASTVLWMAGCRKKTIVCHHYRYRMGSLLRQLACNFIFGRFLCLVTLAKDDEILFKKKMKRVCTIPNMIPIERGMYAGVDCHRILCIGRLIRDKGFDLLLDALAQIRDSLADWQIDIFGEGVEREALERQCRNLHLEQYVHIHGATGHIEREYATSGIFVLPSRMEGQPMVLLEAAAYNLPIVATRCSPGTENLLAENRGILVGNGNVPELAAGILKMIQDDKLRAEYSCKSIEITKPYLPENIYKQWMNLFSILK